MSKRLNHSGKNSLDGIWLIGFKLFCICAVTTLCLGILNQFTAPVVKKRLESEKRALMQTLVVAGEYTGAVLTDDEVVRAYYPVKKAGRTTAYILELTGKGYGGELKIIAAYEPSGKILRARLYEQNETPGLGELAVSPVYMDRFTGTGSVKPVPVTKELLTSAGRNSNRSYEQTQYNSFYEWLWGKGEEASGKGAEADSVSGATITFNGIAKALAAGAHYVKSIREDR